MSLSEWIGYSHESGRRPPPKPRSWRFFWRGVAVGVGGVLGLQTCGLLLYVLAHLLGR